MALLDLDFISHFFYSIILCGVLVWCSRRISAPHADGESITLAGFVHSVVCLGHFLQLIFHPANTSICSLSLPLWPRLTFYSISILLHVVERSVHA